VGNPVSRTRPLLAGLVVAGGSVLALPGTAHACSCVPADPRQLVDRADAVVWAEVRDVRSPADGTGQAHYLLDVETVYKGEVTERVQVDSAASGAACGLEDIRADRRYVFFLRGAGSRYTADLCGGTGRAVDRAELRSLAGTAEPEAGGPTRLPPSPYSWAGVGAGALGGVLGMLLAWRRGGGSGAP
jgi:hypothetical protein